MKRAWPLALALAVYAIFAMIRPYAMANFVDLDVYRAGGRALLEGASLYAAPLEHGLSFVYTPFAAALFVPLAVLPAGLARAAWFLANVVLLAFAVRRCLRTGGTHFWSWTAALLWIEPVMWTICLGQINLALLALVIWDLTAPNSRFRGVGVGVAAGIKLTPAFFVPYLLLTRQFRAAATAVVSFALTVAFGFVVAKGDSLRYWSGTFSEVTRDASWVGAAANRGNQSLSGLLARLLGMEHPPWSLWWALAIAVGLSGLAIASACHRRGQILLGLSLCGMTAAAVSPMAWSHHWVWLVPWAIVALPRIQRKVLLGLLVLLTCSWPFGFLTGDRFQPPLGLLALPPWHGLEVIYGNPYLLVFGFALIAATRERQVEIDENLSTDGAIRFTGFI